MNDLLPGEAVLLDPAAWALRINACWRKGIEAIIGTGRLLNEAKESCDRGEFENMLETDLAFQPRTAQRLMAIARDTRLTNPTHASLLPASWTTLYELTQLSDDEFDRGVEEKIIRPDMERKDVATIRPPVHRERTEPDAGAHPREGNDAGIADQATQPGTLDPQTEQEDRPARPDPLVPANDEPAQMPGGGLAIAHNRLEPSDSLDFFPTPPWGTRALVERVLRHLQREKHCKFQSVWEPACGEGHMAEVLREYFREVRATDIEDYRYGEAVIDFLHKDSHWLPDWIITNPPFNDGTDFVLKALELAGTGVAMFVRLQWLETLGRYERIFRETPPTLISFFVERVPLHKGRWEPEGDTFTGYVWLTWLKGAEPQAPFWIPPGCRESLTKPDDASRFTQHPVQKSSAAEAAE